MHKGIQFTVPIVFEISVHHTEMPGDFYSPFILSFSNNILSHNSILLKVVVNDCSLYACSIASLYSRSKDSLYICLALLLMYCITPLGITSGAVSD